MFKYKKNYFSVLIVLAACLLLISCKQKKEEISWSDDKLEKIIFDLNMADVTLKKYPADMKDSMANVFRTQICQLNNITEEELDRNINLLQDDSKKSVLIYNNVIQSIKEIQNKRPKKQ